MSCHSDHVPETMSLEDLFGSSAKELAGSTLVLDLVRELQRAFHEEKRANGITYQAIADRLGIDKALAHRRIQGRDNMSLRTIGELIWALNRSGRFALERSHVVSTQEETTTSTREMKTSAEAWKNAARTQGKFSSELQHA